MDTNVCIVANGAADVDVECRLIAVRLLRRLTERGHVLVDDLGLILREYGQHLSHAGSPGVGDQFFVWLRDSQWGDARCERVHITPRDDDPQDFEEFPRDHPGLETFDRSDRKFAAVARAYANDAMVANVTDSDWCDARVALAEVGVRVHCLCPDLCQELAS